MGGSATGGPLSAQPLIAMQTRKPTQVGIPSRLPEERYRMFKITIVIGELPAATHCTMRSDTL